LALFFILPITLKTFIMNSGPKVLLGALAGAAAGALVAGLFATEEGAQKRRQLSQGSKDLKKKLKGKLGDVKTSIAETYDTVKQSATDLLEENKGKASGSNV
jgi:gas vesicle protein